MSKNGAIAWRTEWRRLGDLIPWEDNPRQSTEPQAKRIQGSLVKFGYSQLLEIEPDNVLALKRKGSAYFALNQKDKARDLWQQAFKLAPDDAEIKKFLTAK